MYIKRRDFIRLGALGGASIIVPSAAWAMPGGPPVGPPEQILGALLGLALDYFFPELPPGAASIIISLFETETKKLGRAYSTHSQAQTPGAAAQSAPVNATIHKSSNGSLLVHGHMIDGGKTAFSHDGTAPSHTHPLMQQHVATIVGGCHSYLKGTNR